MFSVRLPGTSLVSSRLGFGTSALHHLKWSSERQRLLLAALDAGFTHFDTARMYGDGMAERAIGSCLSGGLRQHITLATKFGIPARPWAERYPPLMYAHKAMGNLTRRVGWQTDTPRRCLSVAAAEASLVASLGALRTDWVDLWLVHEPRLDDLPALKSLANWLEHQKNSGRVRALGLAGAAVDCLAIHSAMPGVFDVLQVEDSIACCEAEVLRAAGVPLQVTYGYLRLAASEPGSMAKPDPLTVLKSALLRNHAGMVLVSTRKPERLPALAALAS